MSNKIVVTGANGALGRAVMKELIGRNVQDTHKIVAVKSRKVEGPMKVKNNIMEVQGIDLAGSMEQQHVQLFADTNILLHCTGGFHWSLIDSTTDADMKQMFDMNFQSAFQLTRIMLPYMKQTYGRMVFVSSTSLQHAAPGMASYLASKSALEMLSKCIRTESAGNILSTCVRVNVMDTETNRKMMPHENFLTWTNPERVAQVMVQLVLNPSNEEWKLDHHNIV